MQLDFVTEQSTTTTTTIATSTKSLEPTTSIGLVHSIGTLSMATVVTVIALCYWSFWSLRIHYKLRLTYIHVEDARTDDFGRMLENAVPVDGCSDDFVVLLWLFIIPFYHEKVKYKSKLFKIGNVLWKHITSEELNVILKKIQVWKKYGTIWIKLGDVVLSYNLRDRHKSNSLSYSVQKSSVVFLSAQYVCQYSWRAAKSISLRLNCNFTVLIFNPYKNIDFILINVNRNERAYPESFLSFIPLESHFYKFVQLRFVNGEHRAYVISKLGNATRKNE